MSPPVAEPLLEQLAKLGRQGKIAPSLVAAATQRFVSEVPGRPGSAVLQITLFGTLGLAADNSPWRIGDKDNVLIAVVLSNGRVVAGHLRSKTVGRRTFRAETWNGNAVQRLASLLATQPRDSMHSIEGFGELHRGPYEMLRESTLSELKATLSRALSGLLPAGNLARRIAATLAACERFARETLEAGLQAEWLEACPRQYMEARIAGYNFLCLRDPAVRPLYIQALCAYPFLWASQFEHDHPVVADLRSAIESNMRTLLL